MFYIFAIPAIIFELYKSYRPKKFLRFDDSFRDLVHSDDFDWLSLTPIQRCYSILDMLYGLWCVVGCFTVAWPFFVVILLMSHLLPKQFWFVLTIDGLLTAGILAKMLMYKFG